MKIVITGHRPQSLGGFKAYTLHSRIKKVMKDYIVENKPEVVITGMALGVDQWAAQICEKAKIPFIAAVPFKQQSVRWPQNSVSEYNRLLKKAENIIYVDREIGYVKGQPDIYKKDKLFNRNKWMVDQMEQYDVLLAVLRPNGWQKSGTAHCVNDARNKGIKIQVIDVDYIDKGSKILTSQNSPLINLTTLGFANPDMQVVGLKTKYVIMDDDIPF